MKLIKLTKPSEVNSKRVSSEVRGLIYEGTKCADITLILEFCCTDDVIDWVLNEFRKLKNKHAFDFDALNRVKP